MFREIERELMRVDVGGQMRVGRAFPFGMGQVNQS